MGHSSVKVTERYAHLAGTILKDVAAETQAGWEARNGRRPPLRLASGES